MCIHTSAAAASTFYSVVPLYVVGAAGSRRIFFGCRSEYTCIFIPPIVNSAVLCASGNLQEKRYAGSEIGQYLSNHGSGIPIQCLWAHFLQTYAPFQGHLLLYADLPSVCFRCAAIQLLTALQCSSKKALKQRVGAVGAALELRVILHAHVEGVVSQLHGLH